jgi:transcriptional regulator with XRE-family HTH domain
MNAIEQLSSKLRILREVHDYTQEYVAGVLDISQNTYSLIEKGESKLTIDRLEKLANLYRMNLTDLINLNEQTYINTITHSQGVCSQNVHISSSVKDEERELFKSTIERLEKENDRLHSLIAKLTERL